MTQRSLILLLGTDRKRRVHRVSFSRNIFPGESDQRIAEERRHDIPPFTGNALHHPLSCARILEKPLWIMGLLLHVRLRQIVRIRLL
jgi:hypothetical protein